MFWSLLPIKLMVIPGSLWPSACYQNWENLYKNDAKPKIKKTPAYDFRRHGPTTNSIGPFFGTDALNTSSPSTNSFLFLLLFFGSYQFLLDSAGRPFQFQTGIGVDQKRLLWLVRAKTWRKGWHRTARHRDRCRVGFTLKCRAASDPTYDGV